MSPAPVQALLEQAGLVHARHVQRLTAAESADFNQRLRALLDELHLALIAADDVALKRRSGFWGRLLGKDIALAQEAQALRAQAPLLQYRADELAREWDARTHQDAPLHAQMQQMQQALQAALAEAPTGEPALHRRLQRMLDLFDVSLAQMAISHGNEHTLRQHFDDIRTTLLPLLAQSDALEQARQSRHLLDAARRHLVRLAPPKTRPDRSLP